MAYLAGFFGALLGSGTILRWVQILAFAFLGFGLGRRLDQEQRRDQQCVGRTADARRTQLAIADDRVLDIDCDPASSQRGPAP